MAATTDMEAVTGGDWQWSGYAPGSLQDNSGNYHPEDVPRVFTSEGVDLPQTDADARLMAAAMDCCEALKSAPKPDSEDAIAWLHSYSRWWHGERAKAVRKATGKPA